jgi:nicotinate-nucleotide adenylyltransferase
MYSLLPIRNAKIRVGVLGGSFNPAHEGHVYISLEAIKRLKLSYVVWLITPQNPLKSSDTRNNLESRVTRAQQLVAAHPKIIVSDIEKHFPTCYTADTLKRIRLMHPNTEFMWLMGADNMLQVHRWRKWWQIFKNVAVAVFERNAKFYEVVRSKAAHRFSGKSVISNSITSTSSSKAYKRSWKMLKIASKNISSTEIRKEERNEE